MKGFIVTLTLFCLAACSGKKSSARILDREEMQAVMWDIIGADTFTDHFVKKDSTKNAVAENMQLQNKIFALHKVTREEYYQSYDYYVSHADLMKTLLDSMTARAEKDRMKMMEQHAGGQPQKVTK